MPMPGGGRRRRINGLDFICFCFLSEYQTVVIRLLSFASKLQISCFYSF